MAKVTVIATDKDGVDYPKEVDSSEVEKYRTSAEDEGYKFRVEAPLTEEESKKVASQTEQQISMRESALGGLLQGLSLGVEDAVGLDTEKLRQRQEAEHPYVYGGAKFLGSLAPTIGATAAGAAAGGALGGPPGAVVGGILGATGAGGIESYASKPTPEGGKSIEPGDVGAALLSGATEGAGQYVAPAARAAYRGLRGKLLPAGTAITRGATELTELGVNESVNMLNKLKSAKMKIAANKVFASTDDLLKASDQEIYDKLDLPDAEEMINLKKDYQKAIIALGGTDTTPVDAAINILEDRVKQLQAGLGGKLGQPATTSMIGGVAGAVPMVDPGKQLTPYDIEQLNREAAARAYEEAQRRKTEQLLSEAQTEADVRSGVEQRNIERMKKLAPKKKK